MNEFVTVSAPWGGVKGRIKENGKLEFLGIPYGKAERFCQPEAVKWQGVRDCLEYGSVAAQPNILGQKSPLDSFTVQGSEDCLNLNVWAAPANGKKLPVVVYIHGGAFQKGSNSLPARAGDLFMEEDEMIFISVNYRLGIFGFLQLGEEMGDRYAASGNCGASDVLLALKWVRENISAFGADTENITLFGISAGAKLLGSLLTTNQVQNGVQKIVLESGAMQSFRDIASARHVAAEYEKLLGISNEKELLTLPFEKLVLAQADFCNAPGTTCFFGPVLDNLIFDVDWSEKWDAGKRWKGSALLGSCARELCKTAEAASFSQCKALTLRNLFGEYDAIADQQFEALNLPEEEKTEGWVRVLSDFMYRYYTSALAQKLTAEGNPVWCYSFDYLPACHGMGFHFLMRQCDFVGFGLQGERLEAGYRLADEMRRMIRRFICTGAPAEDAVWPQYLDGNKMIFTNHPHAEKRSQDTLVGFPVSVYKES